MMGALDRNSQRHIHCVASNDIPIKMHQFGETLGPAVQALKHSYVRAQTLTDTFYQYHLLCTLCVCYRSRDGRSKETRLVTLKCIKW